MGFWDVMSALGALLVIVLVLVFTYYATRWYARRMGASGAGRHIKVLERLSMGGGASLAIVEISGRHYLLGLSDKHMELICELPDFDPGAGTGPDKTPAFGKLFSDLLDKARRNQEKGDDGEA